MNNWINWFCMAITFVIVCGCSKETTAEVPSGDKGRTGEDSSGRVVGNVEPNSRFVSAEEVVTERVGQLGHMTEVVLGRGVWVERIEQAKITEKVRNDAADKAILRALGNVSESLETTIGDRSSISKLLFNGAKVITSAESFDVSAHEYMVAVAVVWSPELENEAVKMMRGESGKDDQKRGKYSLDEWLGKQNVSGLNMPKSFVDDNGDLWYLGAVTYELSMNNFLLSWARGEEFKKICGDERRHKDDEEWIRKAYAASVAAKLISVDIKVSKEIREGADVVDEEESNEKYDAVQHSLKLYTPNSKLEIQAVPQFLFSIDNEGVQWVRREHENSFTGTRSTMLICAIKAGDLRL